MFRATLEVIIEDAHTALIRAATEGDLPADSDFAIHLPGRYGDSFHVAQTDIPLDDRGIWTNADKVSGEFNAGPLRFESSDDCYIGWPVISVNVYDVPRRLPVEQAVLRLATRLTGAPVEIRVRAG
jgi:hypothetical protein